MESKELRIGNSVSHKGKTIKIAQLLADCAYNEHDFESYWYDELEPIPLTKEWMLKLGFENKHTNIFTKQIIISECTAQEKLKLEGWAGNIFLIIENQFASNGCKHVHELQNLFFSLCGKELEIV